MLAIIIPYYNPRFFRQTLESLAAQSDKRFTVYIGDDASPEDPRELLDEFKSRFDFTYHRFEQNLGGTSLVSQWNRCIERAGNQKWYMILGDDDVLGAECVAEFYRQLPEIEEARVVRFATVKIDASGAPTAGPFTHPKRENAVDFLFNKKRSSLSEYIFLADAVKNIGFRDFPLAWLSDVLAVLEFSGFGTLYSINEAPVYVRISDYNISGRTDNLKPKADAVFQFYSYLLLKHASRFNETRQDQLLAAIAKSYLSNKRSALHFLQLASIYFRFGKIRAYFSFLKSFIRGVQESYRIIIVTFTLSFLLP